MNSPRNCNSISSKFEINKKEMLEELQNANSCLNAKFDEKFESLETNLIDLYSDNMDELKKLIDKKLVDEIKTMFIEVTLDSSNLFVQKFDEFVNKMNLPVNTI
jgi:tRNA A37 N6-isopentenylltransferase MiaA